LILRHVEPELRLQDQVDREGVEIRLPSVSEAFQPRSHLTRRILRGVDKHGA
jgi:hypothetical protein